MHYSTKRKNILKQLLAFITHFYITSTLCMGPINTEYNLHDALKDEIEKYIQNQNVNYVNIYIMDRLISENYTDLIKLTIENLNDTEKDELLFRSDINQKFLKIILSAGATVNDRNIVGETPLLHHCAPPGDRTNHLAKLLLHNNTNPNIVDNNGMTALMATCMLFEEYKFNRAYLNPLYKKELVKLLITFGADINLKKTVKKNQQIKMLTAANLAQLNKWDYLVKLIENTAKKRKQLIRQVQNHEKISYKDIELGICHVKDPDGNNLAHHALTYKNWDVLKKLLYLDHTMLEKPNFSGDTPLDLLVEEPQILINLYPQLHLKNEQKRNFLGIWSERFHNCIEFLNQ